MLSQLAVVSQYLCPNLQTDTYFEHPGKEQIGLYHVKQPVQMNFQASLPCLRPKPVGQETGYLTSPISIIITLHIKIWRVGPNTSISLKSAPPTPTIRIEKGRSDALTRASFVSWRSVTTPS